MNVRKSCTRVARVLPTVSHELVRSVVVRSAVGDVVSIHRRGGVPMAFAAPQPPPSGYSRSARARRSGLTTTSRTLIGVMRWRRKARLGSLLKAKEATATVAAVEAEGATKLGPVAEGEGEAEEQDTGPGGLTVEV